MHIRVADIQNLIMKSNGSDWCSLDAPRGITPVWGQHG